MRKLDLAVTLSLLATTAVAGFATVRAQAQPGAPDDGRTVTRAEAQAHATEMFGKLDLNKDGKLDAADRAAHQAAMFDRLDANHDGSISRQEFADGARPGPGGPGGPRPDGPNGPRMAGPGGMDMGGMAMGGPGMGPMHGMGMMMLAMADTDKDGAISQAEFTAAALAHFDKADSNKDGKLSPEERRAAHQQMRDHMGKMRGMHDGHQPPA